MKKTTRERLYEFIEKKGLTPRSFEEKTGLANGFVSKVGFSIREAKLEFISKSFPELNITWLLTGEGNMLKGVEPEDNATGGNLIPFYDDVASIGGNNEISANTDGVTAPSEYIDTGDWFRDATAAIRHYGESMIEYPTGCILALREVSDRRLIIPGRDYVIETDEYRVTKKVQLGKDSIRAHSTNDERYEDGTLIHQPFDIPFELINKIFLVLGYVVKKNGGTMVFSNNKK